LLSYISVQLHAIAEEEGQQQVVMTYLEACQEQQGGSEKDSFDRKAVWSEIW